MRIEKSPCLQSLWVLRAEHNPEASAPPPPLRAVSQCLVPCRFLPEGLQCSCGPDWYTVGTKYYSEYYTWFLFIFCYIVPLALICFSYSQLLGALRAVSGF